MVIRIKGRDRDRVGYWTPHLYLLSFSWRELKYVGLEFVKTRLAGWTIWWSDNDDLITTIGTLNKLKTKMSFDYEVFSYQEKGEL